MHLVYEDLVVSIFATILGIILTNYYFVYHLEHSASLSNPGIQTTTKLNFMNFVDDYAAK